MQFVWSINISMILYAACAHASCPVRLQTCASVVNSMSHSSVVSAAHCSSRALDIQARRFCYVRLAVSSQGTANVLYGETRTAQLLRLSPTPYREALRLYLSPRPSKSSSFILLRRAVSLPRVLCLSRAVAGQCCICFYTARSFVFMTMDSTRPQRGLVNASARPGPPSIRAIIVVGAQYTRPFGWEPRKRDGRVARAAEEEGGCGDLQ